MNWNHYLSESKAPFGNLAHLGVIEGCVQGIYDLSEIPQNTKVLCLTTPLKKFKLQYTNIEALLNNDSIEAITLTDMDNERLDIFSTMPNLQYLHISVNKQNEIPDLSRLGTLKVLILSGLTRVQSIDFIASMNNLQTLYIYGMNNLTDLTPLSKLQSLKELSLDYGRMSGTGTPVNDITPLTELKELIYLSFVMTVKNKNYDITPLLSLKKLQYLNILPRYLSKGRKELLYQHLPLLKMK